MSEEEIKRMEDFVNATLKPYKPNEYRLGWEDGVRKCYYLVDDLQQKIDKAIEYIKSIKMVNCRWFDYNAFLEEHLISLEELKKKVEEDGTLEGHFIEVNKDKLLEILGDKE